MIVSSYVLEHFPPLALNGVPPGEHPLASASCAVRMISTATIVTNPSAAINPKITNVVCAFIVYSISRETYKYYWL